ncbi:MAG: hypothetical protein ACYDDI_12155 [Candidatus Acidiferrales bacterium]
MKTQRSRRTKAAPKQRKIKYNTEGEEFLFTFRNDGTGTCRDVDGRTDVAFKWNPVDTRALEDSDAEETLQDLASDLFWSEINDQFGEEAVITDDDLFEHSEGIDVEFTCGSRKELRDMTRLILYSFPSIWSDGSERRNVTFKAEGGSSGEGAGLEEDDYDLDLGKDLDCADRARVVELLNFAIGQNTPAGEYLLYNDGAYHRKSGYSWCVKREAVEICRPSFHEIAEARSQLRDYLKLFLSDPDLDRLIPSH